jgi:hypothetical protein
MRNTRTIVTLSEDDKEWLVRYSRGKGLSMAQAVRKGVARLRDGERPSLYEDALKTTHGIWTEGDGLRYQEKLRREWG